MHGSDRINVFLVVMSLETEQRVAKFSNKCAISIRYCIGLVVHVNEKISSASSLQCLREETIIGAALPLILSLSKKLVKFVQLLTLLAQNE